MKKTAAILLTLLMICVAAYALADVEIDATHFPDEAFRNYVKDSFDKDKNDKLSDSELSAAKRIECNGKEIKSLTGIEYFTSAIVYHVLLLSFVLANPVDNLNIRHTSISGCPGFAAGIVESGNQVSMPPEVL